jgi:T-complex protein 1 subunit zeta
MASIQLINPKADRLYKSQALTMNINASKGLQEVLRTNLGPSGTNKMLVGGAGQIKITKDGNVLLHEMQIVHPTAQMIARASTAQDDIVGDGTSSNVLFIGELMKQADRQLQEGIHVSHVVDGIELAKKESLKFLDTIKYKPENIDREFLLNVARSSLRTKLNEKLADQLTEIVTDAVLTVKKDNNIDLHMVEIMHMIQQMSSDSRLVKGLVLDHGGRHPQMPKKLENCYILNCNVSLEFENTEVHSKFVYSSSEQREKLIASEHKYTDDLCMKIIELKRKLCDSEEGKKANKHFVVINQKGIDPLSLDLLAKDGILALRRAKKRNMERIILACGGNGVNSFDDLTEADLGYCDRVWEESLGDDKYTFIDGVKNPFSCTILVKGPNGYSIAQVKDAIRDGLRAVKNVFDDDGVLPGAASFEIACSDMLKEYSKSVEGKKVFGVNAFSEALLIIPKAICENAGVDPQEAIVNAAKAYRDNKKLMGIDLKNEGKPVNPIDLGIFDNFCVKRSFLNIGPVLVQQLLMVDEILRAGRQMGGNKLTQ